MHDARCRIEESRYWQQPRVMNLHSFAPLHSHFSDLIYTFEIEERNSEEITRVMGQLIGPENVSAYNPVFDITPAKYISGIITEKGVARPPYRTSLKKLFYA